MTDETWTEYQSAKYYRIYLRYCSRTSGELADEKTADYAGDLACMLPNQEKRKELMPIANKYDFHEVLDACAVLF